MSWIYGGRPLSAPALREVPLESNTEALAFIDAFLRDEFDLVVLLTGVGTRALLGVVDQLRDRAVFVAALARTIADAGLSILSAHIDGYGARAVDAFYVTGPNGAKLSDARKGNALKTALLAEDPGAAVLPYCLSGGTDNKAFSRLGIQGYGFAPLQLPAGLDFAGMFHGVDERVPLESLRFGVRTFDRFLSLA